MEKLHAVGVRKGAWTKEEDILLTECIHKFGEGRWHLVPLRAGLNRCRKSCRLRWLNYLNPNVKRGLFTKDEVDLIVRMHKLLGNRWTLIAGRIPGRTANDIKNYWNTRMIHKNSSSVAVGESHRPNKSINTESSIIIRPQPRTISCPLKLITAETNQQQGIDTSDRNNEIPMNMLRLDDDKLEQVEEKECMRWWANLLEASKNENGARVPFSFPDDHDSLQEPPTKLSPGPGYQVSSEDSIINDGGGLCGFDLDEQDIWELVGIDNTSSNNQ